MTLNSRSSYIMKCASDLRHVFIPFMVYSTELTVWALLIREGAVTCEWSSWRVGLLVALFLLFCTAVVTFGEQIEGIIFTSLWVIAPWLIVLFLSLIRAFIDMSMAHMNVDLFLAGTILSAAAQAAFILALHQKYL